MSARNELNSYVGQLERRLRLATLLRGAAIFTSAALVATLLLVLIANAFAFSGWSVGSARFILLIALAAAAAFGIAFPLWRLEPQTCGGRRRKSVSAIPAAPRHFC